MCVYSTNEVFFFYFVCKTMLFAAVCMPIGRYGTIYNKNDQQNFLLKANEHIEK